MALPSTLLGFDVGGTKIEAALLRRSPSTSSAGITVATAGESFGIDVVGRHRLPTDRAKGFKHIVEVLRDTALEACRQGGLKPQEIMGIGLALPGSVDPRTQRMLNGNTLVLVNAPVMEGLAEALGVPRERIRCENDAACFALAEALAGAGRMHGESRGRALSELTGVGVILGTGCGGGFISQGRILRGRRGGGAEVGHVVIEPNGWPCYCGRRGCAEQYLSGSALEAAFFRARSGKDLGIDSAREIFAAMREGNPVATAVVKEFKRQLAEFLANLCAVLDPDYFVLGGGISLQDVLYEGIAEEISSRCFLPGSETPVYKHVLGDSAGVIGAALLHLENRQ